MGVMKEFKEFAMKGNVVDMAVGFILGGAFSTIVKSLVNDVIMPPIGLALGGVDFANLKVVLKEAVMNGEEVVTEAVSINYGMFINNVISFIIVAACLFFIIKAMNSLKKKEEEAPAEPEAPPPPPREQVLLEEIRDLLKK
ncbi:large-conductance mechanosensitive channel protein MscL [Ponticaulis sp.]|uniref:large-conductance mechanosensitive channel protein MscL n=1 Tax=Ponticaulis sp. TaxID=2020902 RepID=UPI000C6C3496|nr:large-conductance mechanosensitive channel protein MscL [Ponticaulis sp.]MAJ10414.1 large conductance mechanosensitive channel protein MscL [Ponticaulis sp.]MDF1680116.1 large-conductance mechanosensitive channel protein MscL [Ponticaulis sp.]HBH91327.1 large conductance mechanosensitive channel protein MscL [Hyphomonadaceae bacterium]|tara:strand:+ start:3310 stop:3732 length:423 start_codon:yes stop_codon:yes gene_type:complete